MAKRLTDTDKWRDPWFCSLTCDEKNFWFYLLDTCNLAGIWQVNWPLVRFYIPDLDFRPERFANRIQMLSQEKWFIPKFLKFQYGELQNTNRLHQRVISELQKEGVSIPLVRGIQGVKDKDKDKEEGKGYGENQEKGFDLFWSAYPRKIGKDAARRSWKNKKPPLEEVLKAIAIQKTSDQWLKDGGQFIPHPATWINQGRWKDELSDASKLELVI